MGRHCARSLLYLSDVLSSQRDTLQRLRSELNEFEAQKRNKQNVLKGCDEAIARHHKESRSLRLAVQRAESVVEELQDALDQDAVEEGRLEALKEHLQEAQEEKAAHEGSYEDSIVALDKVRESMRVSRDEMRALDLQIAEIKAKIGKAENKALKASSQRTNALQAKNSAIKDVEDVKSGKAAAEKRRTEQITRLADFTAQASDICARVPVAPGETGDTLDKKLCKLDADLKKFNQQ